MINDVVHLHNKYREIKNHQTTTRGNRQLAFSLTQIHREIVARIAAADGSHYGRNVRRKIGFSPRRLPWALGEKRDINGIQHAAARAHSSARARAAPTRIRSRLFARVLHVSRTRERRDMYIP